MKKQFPNNSLNGSNIYDAVSWRTGIHKLKKQLTCDRPTLSVSGTTATLNLTFKGMGAEFWNVENMTVSLNADNVTRAIYIHSDTTDNDNAVLKTFVLSETNFNITTTETGVNAVICTIQGVDLSTLIWQFDGFCGVVVGGQNYSVYVGNNQNYNMQMHVKGYNVAGLVTCEFYNYANNFFQQNVALPKYSQTDTAPTTYTILTGTSNTAVCPYRSFNSGSFSTIISKSDNSRTKPMTLLNADGYSTSVNDSYNYFHSFIKMESVSTPPLAIYKTNGQVAEFDVVMSDLGNDTIVWIAKV